jgi:hypothetical protein
MPPESLQTTAEDAGLPLIPERLSEERETRQRLFRAIPFLPVHLPRLSRWFIRLETMAGVGLRGSSGHGQGTRVTS